MPAERISIPISKKQDQTTSAALKRLEDDLGIMVDNIYTDVPEISLVSGGTIALSDDVEIIHETGAARVSVGDLRVTTSGTDTASVVTVAGTQTLTNKSLTSPTLTSATLTSPTVTTPTVSGALPATGSVTAHSGTSVPAGGTAGAGFLISSTSNLGMFFGSGTPSLSAAKGSVYIRSDGAGTNSRFYVATSSTGAWTAVLTVA